MSAKAVTGGHKPAGAVLARDAALGRISRTRRWIIVGAAALTAALAALASVLLPGKSLRAKSRVTAAPSARAAAPTRSSAPALPAPADAAQLGLQSPGQPPQAAPAPQPAPQQSAPQPAPAPAPSAGGGAVVSGGS